MAIPARASEADIAKLPDVVRAEYAKGADGFFYPQITPVAGYALENVEGLKNGLSAERETSRQHEKRLKAFEGITDPDAARNALAKVGEMASWKPEQKVKEQIDEITRQLVEKHGGERAKLEAERAELETLLAGEVVVARATAALAKQKGNVELLLPHVVKNARMLREHGRVRVMLVSADGKTPILTKKANDTSEMGFDEYVELMKSNPTYAAGFDGTDASGSGARRSESGQRSGASVEISAQDARDHQKYKAARAKADKEGVPLVVV
jgi:hypothetical protein